MTKDEALDLALEALEHMLEDAKQERLTVEYWNECVDAITAINQARSAPVQSAERGEPVAWYRDEDGIRIYYESKVWDDATPLYTTPPAAQPAPVQEPVDTLIEAWQALEETSGHVLDVGDVEGRMHISVIRSAWEQMDSLVREIWDERGRP